jgi:four helix bundle protein
MLAVYRITKRWPESEKYGFVSQTRRAAFSAAVNIVEGSCKRGPDEFARFLDTSIGSLGEVTYCILCTRDVGILEGDDLKELQEKRESAGRLTWRLYEAVSKRSRRRKRP